MLDNKRTYNTEVKMSSIDFRKIIFILWSSKTSLLVIVGVSFFIGVAFALLQPNVYRAEALIAPSEDSGSSSLSAMASQFGGIASLAGLNLGQGSGDRTTLAIEVLQSRAFLSEFINKRQLAAHLLASPEWDGHELKFDENIFDIKTNIWNSKMLRDNQTKPSDWDLYNEFTRRLNVNEDKLTGLIKVSIDYVSPIESKNWVDWLISDLNNHIREADVQEARSSVTFLEKELRQTPIADMQKIFYQLIEKQYQTIMLANVREQYMFKVIDPAVVPQEKIKPKRSLIVLLFLFSGCCLAFLFIFVRNYFSLEHESE